MYTSQEVRGKVVNYTKNNKKKIKRIKQKLIKQEKTQRGKSMKPNYVLCKDK